MPTGQAITKEERADVDKTFGELLQDMQGRMTDEDKVNITKAYELAVDAHKRQRRKSGEPYIYHPIAVARICFEEIGLGPTAVISALLHDVVEDTDVTLEEIIEQFGPKIGLIVDGLTKLDGLYNVESAQAENFRKVLSTLIEDVRVVLIKMADRLHNLRTIGSMPIHKQLKIAAETSYIYTPLAHRLGLYKVKMEYNDICLKINEPDTYYDIAKKLVQTEAGRQEYIEQFISPLNKMLTDSDLPYRVLGRAKSISSIHNKLVTKRVPFEEIYDLFAVRIIIDVPVNQEKSACWQVYSIITDVYKPIPERLKDWVTTPKGNGYESLHTTVIGPGGKFVEVQIRSERMDDIAERGFAAHWKYKGIKSQENVYDSWLDNIRSLMESSSSNALEFINDFKTSLFSEEVYVFTPTGDMRVLPKGATALDFAFDIHTDVGYTATAIKVNNKLVPMGYELSSGDQIHVTTSKNQKPNEQWLKMVVTGKARSKIRSSMKEERKKKGEIGKESLMRKFKNLKIDWEENIDYLVKKLGFNSRIDLYYAVSTEEIKMTIFKKFEVNADNKLVEKVEPVAPQQIETAPAADKKTKKPVTNKSKILVNGEPADLYKYEFASCCKPVKGDHIFGFTSSEGLKIHRTNCPNATHMLANYGYRVLKAEWVTDTGSSFVAELQITGVDSGIGVISKLTSTISANLGINIRSFSIEGMEGYFECKVSIFVMNKDQLSVAMKAIENLEGIHSVSRVISAKD